MTEKNRALEKVSIGIANMFGVFWIYSIFLRDSFVMDPLYKTLLGFLVLYGLGLIIFLVIISKIPNGAIKRNSLDYGLILKCFLLQFTALIVSAILTAILIQVESTDASVMISSLTPEMLFILIIYNPIVEEFVFRRLFAVKLLKYGELFYIFVSSFCFSLVHLVSLGIPQMVYTFILGLIWAYLYVKTGRLSIVIFLHSLSNLFGAVFIEAAQIISTEVFGFYLVLIVVLGIIGFVSLIASIKKVGLHNAEIKKDEVVDIFTNRGVIFYTALVIAVSILKMKY